MAADSLAPASARMHADTVMTKYEFQILTKFVIKILRKIEYNRNNANISLIFALILWTLH